MLRSVMAELATLIKAVCEFWWKKV